MKNNKRIMELDAIRGIGALMVMLYHYTTRYQEVYGHIKQPYFIDAKYGYLGVQLFFILSGFVIMITVNNSKNIKEFIIKRLTRLYPAYMVGVILTTIAVRWFNLSDRIVSFSSTLINLTMLQSFIGVKNVDGVYWTLKIELLFFLVFVVLIFLKLTEKIKLVSTVWLLISTVVMILANFYDNIFMSVFRVFLITDYCNLFIIGLMLYSLDDQDNKWNYLLIALSIIYQFVFKDLASSLAVVSFTLLVYLLKHHKLKFLSIKPLVFVGTISYPIYLIHQNFGYIIIRIMEQNNMISEFYLIIPALISIAVAYLISRFIEQPVNAFVKRLLKSKQISKPLT